MKESFTLVSGFYWKEVFKPSFIGRLQTGIARIFGVGDRKKKYSTTKFNLIIVPVETHKSIEQTAVETKEDKEHDSESVENNA